MLFCFVNIITARLVTSFHHLTLETFWTIIRLLAPSPVIDGYESLGSIHTAAYITGFQPIADRRFPNARFFGHHSTLAFRITISSPLASTQM